MADPVHVSTTIDAPTDRVLEVVSDLEKPDRWADEAKSADVQSRDERGRPTRIVVTLGAIGFTTTATYDVSYGANTVTMTCVDASLIHESTIVYEAHEEGEGRTRLDMSVTMEVTVPVPQWGLRQAMHRSQEKNLEGVKADAEAAEPSSPR